MTASTQGKPYFNGLFTQHGEGEDSLFIAPQGDITPKSYNLNYACTNNQGII